MLAPVRYLFIRHPEKWKYDLIAPIALAIGSWGVYWLLDPKPALFGDDGLLRFARDLLVMAVPFMVGALAAVAMGSPGVHLDSRPRGVDLRLDGRALKLRQFVCYLLGYLCFVGLITLAGVVGADLLRADVLHWIGKSAIAYNIVKAAGTFILALLLSVMTVAVFWSLYFLTDVVNDTD
ncbi:MAG: hypothetical protein JST16_10735 [Bdellovibrionales bacterium]|nr:hypothetical protein [Bdellovibrionales bacterium]